MSHEGNDKITDNIRDSKINIDDLRIAQINKLVHNATEMGFGIVQEIAVETLKRKPGCSVKEFLKVLDDYLAQQKTQVNNNG
jgi:hypothetical protein|tara:strand:+ start:365 stop:610 length:246 start_codon:yes stop_codon:yes gene_type:complete